MLSADQVSPLKLCTALPGVHLNLARQVMTPIPPSDVLFSDEATDKEETHWHPTTGSISRPLKIMTV